MVASTLELNNEVDAGVGRISGIEVGVVEDNEVEVTGGNSVKLDSCVAEEPQADKNKVNAK